VCVALSNKICPFTIVASTPLARLTSLLRPPGKSLTYSGIAAPTVSRQPQLSIGRKLRQCGKFLASDIIVAPQHRSAHKVTSRDVTFSQVRLACLISRASPFVNVRFVLGQPALRSPPTWASLFVNHRPQRREDVCAAIGDVTRFRSSLKTAIALRRRLLRSERAAMKSAGERLGGNRRVLRQGHPRTLVP
jgi:hypothetical protein